MAVIMGRQLDSMTTLTAHLDNCGVEILQPRPDGFESIVAGDEKCGNEVSWNVFPRKGGFRRCSKTSKFEALRGTEGAW